MTQLDYTYIFDDLSDGYTSVQWIHHHAQQSSQTFLMHVDDQQFHWKRRYHLSSLLADCIDLAGAIAVADRLSHAIDKTLRNVDPRHRTQTRDRDFGRFTIRRPSVKSSAPAAKKRAGARRSSIHPLCPRKFNSDNPALSKSGKDARKKSGCVPTFFSKML